MKTKERSSEVNCPLKWHGGKNAFHGKLARWIISLMPPHLHYVEPYFGGGAVLLAKNPEGVSEGAGGSWPKSALSVYFRCGSKRFGNTAANLAAEYQVAGLMENDQ